MPELTPDESDAEYWNSLIEHGVPEDGPGRIAVMPERRLIPLATDRIDDLAAILFATPDDMAQVRYFKRKAGSWHWDGSCGQVGPHDLLSPRPEVQDTDNRLVSYGGGGTRLLLRDEVPHSETMTADEIQAVYASEPWLNRAVMRASAEIHRVQVRSGQDLRQLFVPWHGNLVVLWLDEKPLISAYGWDGGCLIPERPLETVKDRVHRLLGRHPDDFFPSGE